MKNNKTDFATATPTVALVTRQSKRLLTVNNDKHDAQRRQKQVYKHAAEVI